MAKSNACIGVKTLIFGLREGRGAVVDVEEDDVEGARRALEQVEDVTDDDVGASIADWMIVELAEVLTVPFDELGDQLGDGDDGVLVHSIEHRAERVSEAEPADEHRVRFLDAIDRLLGERLFRVVHAIGHQHLPLHAHDPLVASLREDELGAVGDLGLGDGDVLEQGRSRSIGTMRHASFVCFFGLPLLVVNACSSKSDAVAAASSDSGTDAVDAADPVFGGDRPVEVRVPEGYDRKKPAPLLLMLHGFSAGALSFEFYLKMSSIADAHGFFYVAPEGTVDHAGNRFWNATEACCDDDHTGVDDVKYLTGLIEEIKAFYAIDPKRIYVLGHSNGGFMANRLACDRADLFAAAVSLAGAVWQDVGKCKPSAPVGFLQIHGTADKTVLYAGDPGTPPLTAPYPGAEQTVATWGKNNGCSDALVDTGKKLHVDADLKSPETSVLEHSGCKANGSAELWKVEGAPHIFAFPPEALESTWKFLDAHAKP